VRTTRGRASLAYATPLACGGPPEPTVHVVVEDGDGKLVCQVAVSMEDAPRFLLAGSEVAAQVTDFADDNRAAVLREVAEAIRDGRIKWRGSLTDFATDIEGLTSPCSRSPEGWFCTRAAGHDGPCAADRMDTPWTRKAGP
jgi:hypothetical protein